MFGVSKAPRYLLNWKWFGVNLQEVKIMPPRGPPAALGRGWNVVFLRVRLWDEIDNGKKWLKIGCESLTLSVHTIIFGSNRSFRLLYKQKILE